MPPKLSKAEREQLRKEEAERKAREEEERRAREEEEEREREERERIEREEEAERQALQDARIAEETEIMKDLQTEWSVALEARKNEQAAATEWNHFLSCSKLPLVTDEKALNTWISSYEDAPVITDIDTTLEDIKSCLILCSDVECLMEGDGLPAPPDDKLNYYHSTLHSMRATVLTKLALLTHQCSLNAESHLDPETYNLTLELAVPGELVLCLWGNVAKNPRLKDFSFEECSFSLELPKPLILADIVISLLYPPFDTLTPLARSYELQKAALVDESSAATSEVNGESEGEKREVGEEGEEGGELAPENTEAENSVGEKEQHDENEEKDEEGGDEEEEEEEEKEERGKEEVEQPELEEDEVDLRRYRPAGGPIILSVLELPAPPKTVGQWTIRKVITDGPQPYTYPQELLRATQPTASQSSEVGGVTTPPAVVPGSTQWPPIEITMSLPSSHIFSTEPRMGQWDSELNIWRTKGITDATFDMNDKSVTFKTYHFSPLAIMVDQYSNMPYRSWEVVPKGLNHTVLQLNGAIVQVAIEIKERKCVLLETSEESSLSHLVGKTMTARLLLSALKKSGANFDPEPDGHKYCSLPDKSAELEVSVYRYIAMAAASFRFSWSHWNRESGRSNYILQSTEVNKEGAEGPCKVYVCGEHNWRLAVTEDSMQFSMDMAEGSQVHGDLYSTLLAESPSHKIPTSSPSHMDTLFYWLSHSRPLTYS